LETAIGVCKERAGWRLSKAGLFSLSFFDSFTPQLFSLFHSSFSGGSSFFAARCELAPSRLFALRHTATRAASCLLLGGGPPQTRVGELASWQVGELQSRQIGKEAS